MATLAPAVQAAITKAVADALAAAVPAGQSNAELAKAIDQAWVVYAATLILLMQAGFAMLEVGAAPMKNASAVMGKILVNMSVSWIMFWLVGFYLAYTPGNDFVGNMFPPTGLFTKMEQAAPYTFAFSNTPAQAQFFFQVVFCSISLAIVWGAMLDRTAFPTYVVFAIVFCGIIYPIGAHWSWGGGWLFKYDFLDFAGSSIVHLQGACAAAAGTIVLGPRIGRFVNGKPQKLVGHSMILQVLGLLILWVGWMGFNPGSFMGVVGKNVADIAVNTNLAGAAGVIGAMLVEMTMTKGNIDVNQMCNGAIGGLVAITAGCAYVDSWAAIFIGFVAGMIVPAGERFFEWLHIDDPINCLSAHGMSGIWGTVALGALATHERVRAAGVHHEGFVYGASGYRLGVQIMGVVAMIAWDFGTSLLVFIFIKLVFGIRVDPVAEEIGLDIAEHGVPGLPENQKVHMPGESTPVMIGSSTHGQEFYKKMLEHRSATATHEHEPGASWNGAIGRSLHGMLMGNRSSVQPRVNEGGASHGHGSGDGSVSHHDVEAGVRKGDADGTVNVTVSSRVNSPEPGADAGKH